MKATLGLTALLLTSATTVQASSTELQSDNSTELDRKMLKTVSTDMGKLMERLEGDWEFIGTFLDNPADAIKQYDLKESEVAALTTRDVDQLMKLGLSEEEVTVAMSGTHRGIRR
ncbi:MAG: hypothetical protein ACJAS4_000859 [Bacteriovoracaceae bacterium]|jgi:hypothetical protein